jgi:UDP-N-acetylglucosamine acyltransferase
MTKSTYPDADIHSTAVVEEGAIIEEGVTVEPYAIVKKNVILRKGVTIKSHAYIDGYTEIGEETTVYPSASIGTKTQDLKFRGEKTYVSIGKKCEIREFVTINSSCEEGSVVSVGDNCLIMAYCHVAHNCTLGKGVIMGNNATLAGHVDVEDYAIISGLTPVHQFSRIGSYAMVGGLSRVTHDVPPYTIGAGIPFKLGGLNLIGLKRHGFSLKVRQELSKVFKLPYRSQLRFEQAIEQIERDVEPLPEVLHWLNFCRQTKRGLIGLQGVALSEGELGGLEEDLTKN